MRPKGSAYRADIDGLRAIAVGAVLLFHAYPGRLTGGFVGVDIFFVISGFLISRIIAGKLAGGSFSLRGFYAARVMRIYPVLILVLAVTLVVGWFALMADAYTDLGWQTVGATAFVANLLFWHQANYFSAGALDHTLLHLWSLGVEEQFYLAWPLILAAAFRFGVNLRATAILIALASFVCAVWLSSHNPTAAFYSPLSRAWELMAGALVALYPRTLARPIAEGATVTGLLLIAAGLLLIDYNTPFPGWSALLPCIGTALLIYGEGSWFNRTILGSRPFVFGGLISYSLYLWHWPIFSFAAILHYGDLPHGAAKIGLMALSVALAVASFYLIESNVGLRRHLTVMRLAIAMMVVALAGLGIALSGFPQRPINQDPQRRFVEAYKQLHRTGLGDAYRLDCDFMDPTTGSTRSAIPRDCTVGGARATVFLWGDSHAQALSVGLRAILPPGVALAQVASSGCRPSFEPLAEMQRDACGRSTRLAIDSIHRLKPAIVVLAQRQNHDLTDWNALAARLHGIGVAHVVLVGPAPEWIPSLPDIVASNLWGKSDTHTAIGLDQDLIAADRVLAGRYALSSSLRYVSLETSLCDARGCLVRVPGLPYDQLMAVDYGHLSPDASRYVGRTILAPVILHMLKITQR